MFRNSYQRGMLTIFYSAGANPFKIWEPHVKNGHITRSLDEDIRSMTCDIRGTNVSTTYIICPKGNAVLGISMPFLVMIVKNLKKYFTFEVTILDDTGTRRRFRISNFQSTTQILPLCTVMPIGLSEGWNQIQFNLAEFTRRAYKKQFMEVQKLKINANIRLRRIYFAERLVPEDELPAEYKLFFPLSGKRIQPKRYGAAKENEEIKPVEKPVLTEKILSSEMIKAPSVHSVQKRVSVNAEKEEKEQTPVVTSATATTVGEQEEGKGEATPQPDGDQKETEDQEAATKDQATTVDAATEPMTEEKAAQVDASNNESFVAAPAPEDQAEAAEPAAEPPPPSENVAEEATQPE